MKQQSQSSEQQTKPQAATRSKRVPVEQILTTLHSLYPDAHCELNFTSPFELLIATILVSPFFLK